MDKLNRSKCAFKDTTKLETFVEESRNHTPTKLDIKLNRVQEMNRKIDELKDQYYETKDISDAELAEIEADLQEMEDRLEDLELVNHSADMAFSYSPKKYEIVKDYVEEEEFFRHGASHDSDFEAEDLNEPHMLNRAELNDLVRNLDLPKQKTELLASRLHQWNLILSGVKITEYRSREKNLLHFFEKKEHVAA
ncbi:hypothetical protein TNCT_387671 [Trichonephila clavata]|uniref:Uncharacterized protein n=1 Tax=Trichonephila clavata TaxID=2740835 RepID=A0A8X6LAB5_TRICU|nr:hypothetical protein TNCT_387671 [Trichonephila clavata]